MKTEKLLSILLVVPALFLLGQSLNYGFVSDDFHLVYRMETEGFFFSWGGENNNTFFRPVTVVTYMLDNSLWSLNPSGYHLTNILWHLLCSVLVYLLAMEMFKDKVLSFLSGYLFLLLACHSESVAWIAGRTDLVATAFAVFSILLFLRKSYLTIPVFVLGLLAKESVVIIPVIWCLLGVFRKSFGNRRNNILIVSGVTVCIVYIVGRLLFSQDLASGIESAGITIQSVSELFGNLVRYSFRIFIPALPIEIRPFVLLYPLAVPAFLAALGFVMWLLYREKRNRGGKELLLFVCCFLVSLLPVILMKVSLFDSRSERFLYLPGVFAVLFFVKWVFSVFKSRQHATAVVFIFALIQGAFLYRSFTNWETAGEMCRTIIRSGSTEIPDNYQGAYVFRNGYEEALILLSE